MLQKKFGMLSPSVKEIIDGLGQDSAHLEIVFEKIDEIIKREFLSKIFAQTKLTMAQLIDTIVKEIPEMTLFEAMYFGGFLNAMYSKKTF